MPHMFKDPDLDLIPSLFCLFFPILFCIVS
jgi:hypothetical protein